MKDNTGSEKGYIQGRRNGGYGTSQDMSKVINHKIQQQEAERIDELIDNNEYIDVNGLTDVQADPIELRKLMKHDLVAFISFLLYDQDGIENGIPSFHVYGLQRMIDPNDPQVVIAWPRDHAKTTLMKIAILYLIFYTNFKFFVYLSNTNTVAADAVRDIADMLRRPEVQAIYGAAMFTQQEESKGNYTLDLEGKRVVLQAKGAGQQIRGTNKGNQRPDFLAIDDLESAQEGEENKLGYEGLKTWYYGTVKKALDKRRNKTVQIGNFVSNKTLLGDHLKSPHWTSIKLSAITKDGKSLWPAFWPLEKLKLDFLEYIEAGVMHTWLCEMLNMPLSSSSNIVDHSKVKFMDDVSPVDERILLKCITVDPAISENIKYADSAVICCHVYLNNYWQLAEIKSFKGIGVFELHDEIMKVAAKWRVNVVGIEIGGYQDALRQVCELECARNNIHHMEFVKLVNNSKSKAVRVVAWASMLSKGLYRLAFSQVAVYEQLIEFDVHAKNNKDDEIDCAGFILQMVDKYLDKLANFSKSEDELNGGMQPDPMLYG